MLRLVKISLYNYRLYKKMMDDWNNTSFNKEAYFLNNLKAEHYLDHNETLKLFLKDEKIRSDEINPMTTYFLFDTKTNGFIGGISISFKHNDISLKEGNMWFSISPIYRHKGYSNSLIDLGVKLYHDKEKEPIIFKVDKNNIYAIKSIEFNKAKLYKKEEDNLFYSL